MEDSAASKSETERKLGTVDKSVAFVAVHDLLQPVITIESAVALLLSRLPEIEDDELTTVKTHLHSATARLRTRIKGVLAYSRLQEQSLDREALNPASIVGSCLGDLDTDGAEVEVGELPRAQGSPVLVAQVVQNLLSNAFKYRHRDRPCRVEVSTSDKAPSGLVTIRIGDNGIGVAPKVRTKIFELFGRLHSDLLC